MDEHEVWWEVFWTNFDDRKRELVMKEGKTQEQADEIAREEFGLDD